MPGGEAGETFERSVLLFAKDQVCIHPDEQHPESRISGKLTLEKLAQHTIALEWTPQQRQSRQVAAHGRHRDEMKPPPPSSMEPSGAAGSSSGGGAAPAGDDFIMVSRGLFRHKGGDAAARPAPAPPSQPPPAPASPPPAPQQPAPRAHAAELYAIRILLSEVRSFRKYVPGPLGGFPQLIIKKRDGVAYPPLYFYDGGLKDFLVALREHASIARSPDDSAELLVGEPEDDPQGPLSLQHALSVGPTSPVHQVGNNPIDKLLWHGWKELSKVTRFARHGANQLADGLRGLQQTLEGGPGRPSLADRLAGAGRRGTTPSPSREAAAAARGDGDDFVLVDDASGPLFGLGRRRGAELSAEEWTELIDEEGRVKDPALVRRRVFEGGIAEELRPLAWRFLLHVYPWESTYAEREGIDAEKRRAYEAIRGQWASIGPAQEARFAKYRERRSRIEKDVVRTDRELGFYAGPEEGNANLASLNALLLTYAFYNFDLGYCQGMSDMAAPILYVVRDEALAFWCLAGLLDERGMASNFAKDQAAMQAQLLEVSAIVRAVDPSLHEYLSMSGSGNFFFCFRWLLIHFKREFEMHQVLRLWEMLWTSPVPRLWLYLAAALLVQHRRRIVEGRLEFDGVLKFANGLAGHLDVDECIAAAEALHRRHAALLEGGVPVPGPAPAPAPAAPDSAPPAAPAAAAPAPPA